MRPENAIKRGFSVLLALSLLNPVPYMRLPLPTAEAAEFEVVDRLLVNGAATFKATATVQGNAFSVGASTLAVAAGRVGIGTTALVHPLDILGSNWPAGPFLFVKQSISNGYTLLTFHTSGAEQVRIDAATATSASPRQASIGALSFRTARYLEPGLREPQGRRRRGG